MTAATGTIWHLLAAVLVFLASHSLTNLKPFRLRAQALVGKRGFYGLYSLLSIVLLAWMVAAYRDAPTVVLWHQQPWMRWVPLIAMLLACQLGVLGLSAPNPFSIGPGGKGYAPAHPGIVGLTRHPVVWALGLWAGAHIVPNGDAAALIMFVPLLVLAAAGPRVLDAKRRGQLGEAEWTRLVAATAPFAWRDVGPWRVLGGLAVYALLLAAHEAVIGASPLP